MAPGVPGLFHRNCTLVVPLPETVNDAKAQIGVPATTVPCAVVHVLALRV